MKQVIVPLETGRTIETTAGLLLWAKQPLNTHTLHYSRANQIATKHPSSLGIHAYPKILYSDSSGCTVIGYFHLRGGEDGGFTTDARMWESVYGVARDLEDEAMKRNIVGETAQWLRQGQHWHLFILTTVQLLANIHESSVVRWCTHIASSNKWTSEEIRKYWISKLTNFTITRLAVQSKATMSCID